jgi:hypothetical protein
MLFVVSDWGRTVYGDPCRECGYEWSLEVSEAVRIVQSIPDRYAELIGGGDGSRHSDELAWSSGAYVCHVTDNLRIWAERLVGAAHGPLRPITPYDADMLARARGYESVRLAGAFWSLRGAVEAWSSAVELATCHHVVLTHPERGRQTVTDVVSNNAHDSYHHAWDIERIEPGPGE